MRSEQRFELLGNETIKGITFASEQAIEMAWRVAVHLETISVCSRGKPQDGEVKMSVEIALRRNCEEIPKTKGNFLLC